MIDRRVVVLSDLHLGPEGPLATFKEGAALAALLDRLADDPTPALEVVLAGDVFDFLQTTGYDGFSRDEAPARFDAIVKGPQTSQVIAALARFAARPGTAVTVLSGNHDPEMMLPAVRGRFEAAIGRTGSVRWADDAPLRARLGDEWPVWGYAVGDAGAQAWIVHGDRWDPHNAIDRDEVPRAQSLALPPGSRLVYEVLQELQVTHRWIPELKPEMGVVVPLLLYLDPKRTMAFLESRFGLTLELLRGGIAGKLHLGDLFGDNAVPEAATARSGDPAATLRQDLSASLASSLAGQLPGDPERAEAELVQWLTTGDAGLVAGDAPVFAAHTGVRRALLRAWLRGVRALGRTADPNGDDGLPGAARRFLPPEVRTLIAGHTHGPRQRIDGGVTYLNTGTWIPVGALHEGDVETVIDAIEAGNWEAEAPRSFAVIDVEGGRLDAYLARAGADGAWERVPASA